MKREARILPLGPWLRRIESADGQVFLHDLASGRIVQLRGAPEAPTPQARRP